MSIRVNLLPEATLDRNRAGRQRSIFAMGAGALLLVLGFAYFTQARQVGQAEDDLAAAETQLAVLGSERDELAPYMELEGRLNEAHKRLETALADEVSFAAVLQDVAAVMPTGAGLTELTLNLTEPDPATAADETVEQRSVGTMNLSGHSVDGHAPGVEGLLLQLDKIADFDEPFFNSSTFDEVQAVSLFNLDVGLLSTARTHRYDAGLPEVLQ